MKYITYLLIKQAMWENELVKEAKRVTNKEEYDELQKKKNPNYGKPGKQRQRQSAGPTANIATGTGRANGVGFGAIYKRTNDPLEQAKIDNAELTGQLHGANMALNKATKDIGFLKGKRKELEEANKTLGFDLTRANMNLEGMRNNRDALYDVAEANRGFGDDMHRRLLATNSAVGGTVGGLAGAGLGYAGSNWLSKKLGLQGPNVSRKRRIADIALRTLGTAGVGALGAYGGSRLGGYMTPANTMAALPSKYVEVTGA